MATSSSSIRPSVAGTSRWRRAAVFVIEMDIASPLRGPADGPRYWFRLLGGISRRSAASGRRRSSGRRERERRSEEHTSELQYLLRVSYVVLCMNKKTNINRT